jgi:cystathionine beta-synthase
MNTTSLVDQSQERKISVSHLLGNKDNKINHLITIQPDAKIGLVVALMKKYGISQLPVTHNGVQVGSVREAAIIKKLANKAVENNYKVNQIMEPPLPTVDVDDKLTSPSNLLVTGNALAVTRNGRIIDVITTIDVINYLMNKVMY